MAYVGSSSRALDVLLVFAKTRRAMRVEEIAIALDLPRAKCANLLKALLADGYLSLDVGDRSYMPTDQVRKFGDWLRPLDPFGEFVTGCARKLHRDLGLPTAVSHREGLYIDWDLTLSVPHLDRGSRLPALKTVNGIVSLSLADSATTLGLIGAHNNRFGRDESVKPYEVLERVNAVRGRDYGAFSSPLFPSDQTICFYVRNDAQMQELLLSVVVSVQDRASWEPEVVRCIRKLLADGPVTNHGLAARSLA